MNRRQLIKRGIAGSIAALVGLPEGKYLKGEVKDVQVFDKALIEGLPPFPLCIESNTAWDLEETSRAIEIYDEFPDPKWKRYFAGAFSLEAHIKMGVPDWMWNETRFRQRKVWLDLSSDDYAVTAVGELAKVLDYKQEGLIHYGTFVFALDSLNTVAVYREFPSDRDKILPFREGCPHDIWHWKDHYQPTRAKALHVVK